MKLKAFILRATGLSLLEFVFCVFCFIYILSWAVMQPYNYGPDEYMRILIPQHIFQNGSLPLGDDPSVVVDLFGSSYAYYPTFFGPLVSALFMKITSFFTMDQTSLLIAARMTSVIAGAVTVFFTIKISKIVFKDHKVCRWLFIVLVAMLPQFTFLSSYINNDILGVCASSIILYSWVLAFEKGFNLKTCILLSVGIVICALSYYTAYGWILCSIVIFFVVQLRDKKITNKQMWQSALIIVSIVLVFISYFFIRNLVLYGDLLGSKAFLAACEANAQDFLKPSLRNTPENLGMSLLEMIRTHHYCEGANWIDQTYQSFIGVFGYMQYNLNENVYFIFFVIMSLGGIGFIVNAVSKIIRRKVTLNQVVFCASLIVCIIIPIVLSLHYSYSIDYQAQGRYCIAIILALMYFISKGLSYIITKIKNKYVVNLIVGAICITIIGINLDAYFNVFIPSVIK